MLTLRFTLRFELTLVLRLTFLLVLWVELRAELRTLPRLRCASAAASVMSSAKTRMVAVRNMRVMVIPYFAFESNGTFPAPAGGVNLNASSSNDGARFQLSVAVYCGRA